MPREVTAAVCHAFGAPLEIETLTLRDPGPGEIEVALEAVAICHSDISYMNGAWGGPLPAVYGHEAVGRVTAVGPGVGHVHPGERRLVTLIRACGTCPSCVTAAPVYCSGTQPLPAVLTRTDGTEVAKPMNCGAFADHVVIDVSQTAPLDDTIPAESACLLACGVPTGVGAAVNSARVRPGQSVVVIGAGGVGLNVIQGARLSGAAHIVALDLSEEKLADAMTFGATAAIRADAGSPWREARVRMNGRGADHVFVSVGAIAAYDSAMRYLGPGGTVHAVGMPHSGQTTEVEPVILAATGQGMRGTLMGEIVLARDIPWMLELYAQGRLKLDELVSRRWRLEEINAAIADTAAGNARRNVIVL